MLLAHRNANGRISEFCKRWNSRKDEKTNERTDHHARSDEQIVEKTSQSDKLSDRDER